MIKNLSVKILTVVAAQSTASIGVPPLVTSSLHAATLTVVHCSFVLQELILLYIRVCKPLLNRMYLVFGQYPWFWLYKSTTLSLQPCCIRKYCEVLRNRSVIGVNRRTSSGQSVQWWLRWRRPCLSHSGIMSLLSLRI